MSDTNKRGFRPIKFLIRTLLTLGGVCLFVMVALSVMGASSWLYPVYKEGIQDGLSDATGYTVTIGELSHLSFFPTVGLEVRDVVFTPKKGADAVATLTRGAVEIRFFDLLTRKRALRVLELEGLIANAGAFTPKSLRIDAAGLTTDPLLLPGTDKPQGGLRARGSYDAHPFVFGAGMDVFGAQGLEVFVVQKDMPFAFALFASESFDIFTKTVPLVEIRGTLSADEARHSHITNASVFVGGRAALQSPDLTFFVSETGHLHLQGPLHFGQRSALKSDITIQRPSRISGQLEGERLHAADVLILSQNIKDILSIINNTETEEQNIIEEGSFDPSDTQTQDFSVFKKYDVDILFTLKYLNFESFVFENVHSHISLSKGILKVPFTTQALSLPLKGEMEIDSTKTPATARFNLTSEQKKGARIIVSLNAIGENVISMANNFVGNMLIVLGEKEMRNIRVNKNILSIFKAIAPDLMQDDSFTCLVADIEIKEGTAKQKSLFLEGKNIIIEIFGYYDISQDDLNIKAKPHIRNDAYSKNLFIDINGPLDSLKFTLKGQDITALGSAFLQRLTGPDTIKKVEERDIFPASRCADYL